MKKKASKASTAGRPAAAPVRAADRGVKVADPKPARSYLWAYVGAVVALAAPSMAGAAAINVDLPLIVAHLQPENGRPGYIRLKVEVEVSEEPFAKQLRSLHPRLVEGIHSFLREYRRSDLIGDRGTSLMRSGITRVVAHETGATRKFSILFRDIKLEQVAVGPIAPPVAPSPKAAPMIKASFQ